MIMRNAILAGAATVLLSLSGGAFAQSGGDENVMQLQQKLQSEGLYNGPIDGINGRGTQQGLRQYQQKNGLQQTGRLDQQTMSHLGISSESAGSTNAPTTPMSGRSPSSTVRRSTSPGR
jgi:peptidoglycan hydrolase-like protein with peptidoglycan-binding domain